MKGDYYWSFHTFYRAPASLFRLFAATLTHGICRVTFFHGMKWAGVGGSSFSFLTNHFQSSAFCACSKHPGFKFSGVRHPSPSFSPACSEQGAFQCWKRYLTDCSSQLGMRRSDQHRAILTSQCASCNVRGLLLMLCWLYSLLWMNYAFKLGISLKIPPVT